MSLKKIDREKFAMNVLEEAKLRKIIKNIILQKKQKINEDKKLRNLIRSLINEQDEVSGHKYTGINYLDRLLKKIIPQSIEPNYMDLTTDPEQRKSYRDNLIAGLKKALSIDLALADISAELERLRKKQGLIGISEQLSVDLDDEDVVIDIPTKSPEEEEEKNVAGSERTGAKAADDSLNDIIKDVKADFDSLSGLDRDLFTRYLFINLLLNLDKFEDKINMSPSEEEASVPGYEEEKQEIEAAIGTGVQEEEPLDVPEQESEF